MIKNKFKKLLSKLKKFKVQTILVLNYKKRNGCKIFNSSAKLVYSDSDIHEAFKSMHQSFVTKKNCAYENWIVFDVTIKYSIHVFFSVSIKKVNSIKYRDK